MGTNDVPSFHEGLEISAIISQKEFEQEQMISKIGSARDALEKLLREHYELQQVIEAHRTLLAPIRRVFPEILGEIFLRCLPDDWESFEPFYLKPPIIFTRVCSTWRAVALSTPRLWCSIFDYVSHRRIPIFGGVVDETSETWLQLSRNCPLSITLHDRGSLGIPLQHDWEDAAEIFAPHINRWKNVTVTHPDASLSLFRASDMGTSWLEMVDITATSWKKHDDVAMQRLVTILQSSPRLCNFSWRTGWLDFHESLAAVPWSQLTHVDLDCKISLDNFLEISSQLTNVEHCALHRVWGENTYGVHRNPVTLPRMLTFYLSCAMDLASLLRSVTLPAIRDLKVDHFAASLGGNAPMWSQSAFDSLFPTSSCRLRRLFLDVQAPIAEAEVLACLQLTSRTLVELYLGGTVKVTDNVLRALTATKTEHNDGEISYMCPKLEIVDFRRCLCSSDGYLADMVESRWKEDTHWERHSAEFPELARLSRITMMMYLRRTSVLHMGSLKTDHDEDLERLKSMRLRGLCGEITHYVSS